MAKTNPYMSYYQSSSDTDINTTLTHCYQ